MPNGNQNQGSFYLRAGDSDWTAADADYTMAACFGL